MKIKPRRFRRAIPDKDGWWLWKEDGVSKNPERLLIAANERHAEVATDQSFARAMGLDYPPENEEECIEGNYWEMTACKEMRGLWQFDEAVDLSAN